MRARTPAVVAVVLTCLWLAACGRGTRAREEAIAATGGGDPDKGIAAIGRYGCGSCHTIPRIGSATGTVGPPLARIASRGYLAGRLTNSPDNMMRWLQHPQQIDQGTVMPEMHVTEGDARDMTAFLYTLR